MNVEYTKVLLSAVRNNLDEVAKYVQTGALEAQATTAELYEITISLKLNRAIIDTSLCYLPETKPSALGIAADSLNQKKKGKSEKDSVSARDPHGVVYWRERIDC
jgi:hypothetical protein